MIVVALLALLVFSTGAQAAPTGCLPSSLKAKMRQVGPVRVLSTHRPGARMRFNRRKMSYHANCRAVDFVPLRRSLRSACDLMRRTHTGGVGCYFRFRPRHIHIDNGPRVRWIK